VLTHARHLILAALVAAPVTPLVGQIARPAGPTASVPVTKVLLFSSGVGYFEHAGTVNGNSSTELRFRTSQINDILKSIVLQDQDGGRVGAVTYPSQDPLTKTLKSFQVDITQNPSLAQLLNQLRGARVTVQSQAERLSGTILGVETHRRAVDRDQIDVPVLNMLSGATIRAVELPSISNLSFDDPQLQDELTKALAALVQARDQDKKPVSISFAGSGDRRVRIGYVVETPIWKTSYRLLLDDKGKASRLQGWAIVENQTESDWTDVSLSLVSGRPISFIRDLYQPLYSTRPTVVPELYAGLRPQVYAGGLSGARDRVDMPVVDSMASAQRRALEGRLEKARDATQALTLNELVATRGASRSGVIDAASSVEALAEAGKLGELFQYTVGNVTLPRQKSAMLPIITDSVDIERVSIYNASVLRTNPLTGVRLRNTTGKNLLQGPVTVLEKGSYAGDARIDNLPPGQERLLSYGIDLDVLVDNTKNTRAASVLTARIDKGVLIIDRRVVLSREYAADNKADDEKTLVIEHAVSPGFKLVDTPKPFETTPTLYRFKGPAAPKKITTLTVKEEMVQNEAIALLPADLSQLVVYNRTGEIPASVRSALARAIQLKQALVDVERDITARTQSIAEITAEQDRIRENMKTVSPSTQYYERLLAKLNEQESSIERLQRERDGLIGRRDALRRELSDYVSTLTVR
jgi:hypothetical protein